jgi:hypothetical protein
MDEPKLVIEEVNDPVATERVRLAQERYRRNSDWLAAHWGDLLPGALGKHVAVAGQEAFVADTPQEAIAAAQAAHPEDQGLLIQYVIPHKGPRFYDCRG